VASGKARGAEQREVVFRKRHRARTADVVFYSTGRSLWTGCSELQGEAPQGCAQDLWGTRPGGAVLMIFGLCPDADCGEIAGRARRLERCTGSRT